MLPYLPSRRLAALVAVAGVSFLVSATLALLVDAAILALVLADVAALRRARPPAVERMAPARVPLGGEAVVEVTLREPLALAAGGTRRSPNERPSPGRRVVWTDDLGQGLRRSGADRFEALLPPRGRARTEYRVLGVERGETRFGAVHLRVLGPLGLVWRRFRIPLDQPAVVQPGLQELRRYRMLALHHRRDAGLRRTREIGDGREFERLREYARGDDPRRIDWKATGRRGETIVREYAAERSQSVVLAVDAGRLMTERFGGRERLDHALAAALVLADAAALHDDLVGVLLFADRVQAFLPPSRARLTRIADVLTSVDARRVEPDYPGAFQHLGRQLRRRSLVVLFTDVIDSRASAALLAHLAVAARRHLPLMIAMRNVELEAVAQAGVADERSAYRRAAAEELLQARAVALNGVRRQGVLVADVRPEDAVTEALSRYIEVKRRGRL